MPIIDSRTGSLSLRVVYDGQPLAGKTTSVRALSERVRGTRGFTTPAESDGRTLYFDWLEFNGGEFGGREIRVHVISVPGQIELRHRRNYLVQQADAIVFVADSRDGHFQRSLELFGELMEATRSQEPSIGVVLQANKRDEPTALGISVMREMVKPFGRVTLIDTIATDGEGIREAFAMALRAALDRAQVLADFGGLVVSELEIRSADQLLASMQERESNLPELATDWTPQAVRELEYFGSETRDTDGPWSAPGVEALFTPDARLPSGYIWPPVEGRAIVHEASQAGIVPKRASSGDWWDSTGGWRFHSARDAVHRDPLVARSELISWARVHTESGGFISPDRALMLASAGPSQFRLWQLVRIFPSLRERLLSEIRGADELSANLYELACRLVEARQEVAKLGINLKCSLWTIGENESGRPVFVGLMPSRQQSTVQELDWRAIIHREFLPIVRSTANDIELGEIADRLDKLSSEVSLELVRLIRAAQAVGV
jgi:signal recognition particle receptor subunit beta